MHRPKRDWFDMYGDLIWGVILCKQLILVILLAYAVLRNL